MTDSEKEFVKVLAHETMLCGIDLLIEMAKRHDNYVKSIRTSKDTGEKWEIVVKRVDNEEETENE